MRVWILNNSKIINMSSRFKTPILFIVFNRPETTQVVFNEIRKMKPRQLFVSADGARDGKDGESEKCEAVRKITEQVDWECEVLRRYSDINLGCKVGASSAVDWFFENVEEGIIIEDDCVPSQSFFAFCEELLEKYRDDERVMHIGSNNFQFGHVRGDGSYYFSKYNGMWGWATWRRAWEHYDISMQTFPSFLAQKQILNVCDTKVMQKHWLGLFSAAHENRVNTWDYQWTYAIWVNDGLCIIPNINLVSNIGFGKDATHTKRNSKATNLVAGSMGEEIVHPSLFIKSEVADRYYERMFVSNPTRQIINSIKHLLGWY
jgi:hypothetical protein